MRSVGNLQEWPQVEVGTCRLAKLRKCQLPRKVGPWRPGHRPTSIGALHLKAKRHRAALKHPKPPRRKECHVEGQAVCCTKVPMYIQPCELWVSNINMYLGT